MGEKLSFELRARSSPEQRCAFCHGGIGASAMACLRCQTIFHEDCAAESGRCPTFGCKEKPPAAAERTFEPWVEAPDAWRGHFLGLARLWGRLVVRTTFFSLVGLPAIVATIGLLLSCSAFTPVAGFAFVVVYLAFNALGTERHFQNGVRMALQEIFPVVLRVFATRDGDGDRIDLRAEGADPTEPVPISIRFGLFGPPRWLATATRVRVFGLPRPGPLVIEDGLGHRWFAPENKVTRRGTRALRRDALAQARG